MENFRETYVKMFWDLRKKKPYAALWGKQSDTGRGIEVSLISEGREISGAVGDIVRISWKSPSGAAGYVNAVLDTGRYYFDDLSGLFSEAGDVSAQLELQTAGKFVQSDTFVIPVLEPVAEGAILASDQFTALQVALASVSSLEVRFDEAIRALTVDGEVITARAGYASLNARLNANESLVASKANASTTYSKAEVDSKDSALSARITDLEARSLKKYGVRRVLEATSPLLTRLYDAVGKTAQVPTDDGTAINDFDAIYPWSHIRECKLAGGRVYYKGDPTYDGLTACDWMVEIPKFYVSITQDATNRDIVISQYRHAGFWLPQVFRTESGAELDKIYVGRFKTGKDGSTDVSRPGLFAENLRDLASFRAGARAKGAGWQQIDLSYVQEVLYPLYMIESATLHSQDYLGSGLTGFRYVATDLAQLAETGVNRIVVTNSAATNYNVGEGICIGTSQGAENIAFDRTILSKAALPDGLNTEIVFDGAPVNIAVGNALWQGAQKTGQTVALTKPSGKLSGTAGRRSHKYRGLEDLFGNVYEWTDGVLINERIAQVCRKPSLYASTVTADYKSVGYTNVTAEGYPKEMGWDENYPEARFPVTVGAGSTTGYCDYHYSNTGLRGAFFGGLAIHGSSAGLFFWSLGNTPTGTRWTLGSRLLFKPPV